MLNMELRKYIECTYEEKKPVLDVINEIIDLANLTRKQGVLALEEQADKMEEGLLRLLIELICDGIDPQTVEKIADNTIFASFETGAKLLEQIIIKEGMLSIQEGENPMVIETKLLALLGNGFAKGKLFDVDETYKRLIEEIDLLTPINGLPEFEKLLNISDRDIQTILLDGIYNGDLSAALRGVSKELLYKFLNNLSKRLCIDILKYMNPIKEDEILAAQQKILDRYHNEIIGF